MRPTSAPARSARTSFLRLAMIVGMALVVGVCSPAAWAGSGRSGPQSPSGGGEEISVTQVDTPDPVSSGTDVAYVVTISSGEEEGGAPGSDDDGLILMDTLPAGSTFVSADPSQGICSESEGVVTCDLGDLEEGTAATVQIVVGVPSVDEETTITNTAVVDEEGGVPGEEIVSTEETTVLAPDQDLIIGFVPATGFVFNTDLGTGATEGNPTTTQMAVPAGRSGVASIAEVEGVPSDCPAPFTCFGQRVDLSAPEVYGAPRLKMIFTFDASSVPPGTELSEVQMFRNGVLVPMCPAHGYADPCVKRKRFVGGGDLRIWVCSSETSGWRGGS
jgi:hypothetical protein